MSRFKFSREPALWIGFLISVLESIRDNPSPEAFIPLLVGIVIRFFVSPAK